MKKKKYPVIGTADLNIEKFQKFRSEEIARRCKKEHCWPDALWQE